MQTPFPYSHFVFEAAVHIGKRLVVGIAAAVTVGHIALLVGSRAFTAAPAAVPNAPDGWLTGVPRAAISCARSYAFNTSGCLREIATALKGAGGSTANQSPLAARSVLRETETTHSDSLDSTTADSGVQPMRDLLDA